MNDDEKLLLRKAAILIDLGTANSLDPESRKEWNTLRDRVLPELKEAVG